MRLRQLSALALCLAACSSSSSSGHPTVDSGPDVYPGKACSVDAECQSATVDLRCDAVRLKCICLSDNDCPSDQFCNNITGECVDSVPGCTSDADCAANQFCNPATRACQDTRGFCQVCEAEIQCGTGNHCLADTELNTSYCTKACSADTDCPSGASCQQVGTDDQGNPDNQCLPSAGQTCQTYSGCNPDSLVDCTQNSDCLSQGTDQVCDVGAGVCRARVQSCPLATVCDPTEKICVPSCSTDQDCAADGTEACVNHICQALSTCHDDSNCPADKVCDVPQGASGGTCVAFCTSDTSCSTGTVCQAVIEADGTTRQACLPGCVHNSDCAGNQLCLDQNGDPFVASGTALGQCGSTYHGAQACQITDACGACEFCGTDHTCVSAASGGYCGPQGSSCDPNNATSCQAYGASATCLSLAGRDGSGNVISSGPYKCGIPCNAPGVDGGSASADNASCPADFVCAALTDSSGNETGDYNCIPADFDCTGKCQ